MQRILSFLLLIALASCASEKQDAGSSQDTTQAYNSIPARDPNRYVYERYTGTIAGKNVTAYLVFHDTSIRGSYYYDDHGIPIELWNERGDTKTQTYTINEVTRDQDASWQLRFIGDKAAGKWSGNGKTFDIKLTRSPQTVLQDWVRADSMRARPHLPEPRAIVSEQYLVPVNDPAPFEAVLAGGNKETTLEASWKKHRDGFFEQYREDMLDLHDSDLIGLNFLNYSSTAYSNVYYDNDGILVVSEGSYLYTGGAHGIGGESFVNYDLTQKKEWTMAEIMTVDSTKLIPILERKAREYFKIPTGKPINDHLFVDEMYVSEIFFITHKGICFNYMPYEIASYAEGEIRLFIPYGEIKSLLKPAFKQRMGIK